MVDSLWFDRHCYTLTMHMVCYMSIDCNTERRTLESLEVVGKISADRASGSLVVTADTCLHLLRYVDLLMQMSVVPS